MTKYREKKAISIARELLELGVLFGDELEWFIRLTVKSEISFKNQNDYLEFEDYVINYIDEHKNKLIEIIDLKTGKVSRFIKIPDASRAIGMSQSALYQGLYDKHIVADRYKVSFINKITIRDLAKGLSS